MVKARVNIRIFRRLFWVSGIYYAPYLRADRAAHSLHKKRVIYNSAVRRLYSAHIIFHKVSVLRKRIPALLNPCVRKVARGYLRALTLNDIKPQKLQIKVVVREVGIEYFGKAPHIYNVFNSLNRRSRRPAETFPVPAAVNLIKKSVICNFVPVTSPLAYFLLMYNYSITPKSCQFDYLSTFP